MTNLRIGEGYDVHRLVEGRKLIIGGVEIAHKTGLLGHSDADVLLHAIMDSLLGAASLGDIGKLFPDSDEKYKGISSLELCREVYKKIYDSGYSVVNIDCTVIAQAPKLLPYIEEMKMNISNVFNINTDSVNVKATTEERLGFSGREEGIAARSVCLIERNEIND